MAGEKNGPQKHAKKSCCIIANQLVPGLEVSSACHYSGFPTTLWLGCFVTYLLGQSERPLFPSSLSSLYLISLTDISHGTLLNSFVDTMLCHRFVCLITEILLFLL